MSALNMFPHVTISAFHSFPATLLGVDRSGRLLPSCSLQASNLGPKTHGSRNDLAPSNPLHPSHLPGGKDSRLFATHLRRHRFVHRSPPNLLLGSCLLHDAFVERRTTRLGPRVGGQGARRGDGRTGFVHESVFIQGWNGRIGDLIRPSVDGLSACRGRGRSRLTMDTRL